MEYKQMHIPLNPKRRSGKKVTMTGITIHSTANPTSTAINERHWLINPSNARTASWHIAVDEKMAVEAIPLNEQAFHASSSVGNNTHIGIEICESGNRQIVMKNTIQLVAKMLFERDWGTDRLKRHYDWNKKICPRILSDNNWQLWLQFVNDVQLELSKLRSQNNIVKVRYKGQIINLIGFMKDDTNYIPIRELEKIGHKIDWDNVSKTVIIND